MEINLPVWGYYPKNNQYFIDPMYAPYTRELADTGGGICGLNTWAKQGYADGFVNPALVRKGWGLDFQLLHPQDPCPDGWNKDKTGWCTANKPEFGDHGLYSKDAFVPKYQYWDGYAPQLAQPRYKEINQFDMRSVNPWTGDYVVYHHPKPSSNRAKYGYLPSKDSLIA